MSADTQSPISDISHANVDIEWDAWLQFSPPTSPRLTQIAAAIRPRLEQRTRSWNIDRQNSPLRSPPIVISDQALINTVRPYGQRQLPVIPTSGSSRCDLDFSSGEIGRIARDNENTEESKFQIPLRTQFIHMSGIGTVAKTEIDSPLPELFSVPASLPIPLTHSVSTTKSKSHRDKLKLQIDDPMLIKSVIGGSLIQWGNRDRRRSLMDDARKREYRKTRDKGACSVCKRRRKRCNRSCMPYIECLNSPQLIFLDKPVDASLFRLRPAPGHPLLSTKVEIYSLTNFGCSEWSLHTSLSQQVGHDLIIKICEFEMHADLKTAYVYHTPSRGLVSLELPRFCIANMDEAKRSMDIYINNAWFTYLRNIISYSDGITREVLKAAQVYVLDHSDGQHCLVGRALKLLAVNRIIEVKWTVNVAHIFGPPLIVDPESPLYGQRPITPVMDTQLDQIVIQNTLLPLRQRLLADLQQKMEQSKKEDWYEIFLTIFILQTNTALLLRHSRHNAISCGVTTRYQSLRLAEEYFHGSNILLAHFHHQCRGFTKLLAAGDTRKLATSHCEKQLLMWLIPAIQSQQANLLALRSQKLYEADLYWAQQMFFDEWIPESKEIL